MRRWVSRCEEETQSLGRQLAVELAPDGVLLLNGELGAGKTVLVRGVAEGLGIDPGEIQSPSFILVRGHQGRQGQLLHIDLFRLEPEEVAGLGLEEHFEAPGVKAVEWAERLPFPVAARLHLRIVRRAGGDREIVEEARSPSEASTELNEGDSR